MGDGVKAFRKPGQFVAVAVPDVHLFAQPVEEWGASVDLQKPRAVLAPGAELDLTAQVAGHQLHPITNPQDRDA